METNYGLIDLTDNELKEQNGGSLVSFLMKVEIYLYYHWGDVKAGFKEGHDRAIQ